jgi:hypothetical protein
MSYRPSSNPPVTAWARHLDTVMRERGWSRVRLFEEIGAEMGWSPKSRSAMLPLLEDREPTPAQAEVLARHFGQPEPQESPEAAHTISGDSLVAAAIDRQTAAIEAQTRMLALVLSRLAPSADVPELDELVAQRTYDELQRPRSLPDPARP